MQAETPTELQRGIFQTLSRSLRIEGFKSLEPEAQVLTLEEASNLLKSSLVPMTNKRQLISYLELLAKDCEEMSDRVQLILDDWNTAPF